MLGGIILFRIKWPTNQRKYNKVQSSAAGSRLLLFCYNILQNFNWQNILANKSVPFFWRFKRWKVGLETRETCQPISTIIIAHFSNQIRCFDYIIALLLYVCENEEIKRKNIYKDLSLTFEKWNETGVFCSSVLCIGLCCNNTDKKYKGV